MGDQVSPEQEYVDSVKDVIEALKETQASSEVVMTLASIWAQHKAGELTALNVVRGQMESQGSELNEAFLKMNDIHEAFTSRFSEGVGNP